MHLCVATGVASPRLSGPVVEIGGPVEEADGGGGCGLAGC